MTAATHSAAPAHLPIFITAPDQGDTLMVVTAVFLLAAVVGFGVLFFWLHSLPERIAHKSHKLQFEVVAVLGLLALFTHVHMFWVIALLLALIEIPDFGGPLGRIAASTEKIAGVEPPAEAVGKRRIDDPASDPDRSREIRESESTLRTESAHV